MALVRKAWGSDFGRTLTSKSGRPLRVQSGKAWILGRCAIHLSEDGDPPVISIHAVEEPRDNGRRDSSANSREFRFDSADDPFVAATVVMRWVNSLEGD